MGGDVFRWYKAYKARQSQEQKDKLQHAGQTPAFFGDLELIVCSVNISNQQNFGGPNQNLEISSLA